MSFILNWVEDKAAGYLKTGIQAGGTLAGNAVGGVGGLIESAGSNAGQGVTSGIGGVGNYFHGYGDNIKRSMSADGPVSNNVKKTAVKPPGPQEKKIPSAQKALPTIGGAQKPRPSASTMQKGPPSKPSSGGHQAVRSTAGTAKPPSKSIPVSGGTSVGRTSNNSTVSRPGPNLPKATSKVVTDGKVRISPESRPKPTTAKPAARIGTGTTSATGKKQSAADPLGVGKSFGDISKTRPIDSRSKAQPPAKPSAADPLGAGDIGLGKRK